MKFGYVLGVAGLLAVTQAASAQSDAYSFSLSTFALYFNSDVTAQLSAGPFLTGAYSFNGLPAYTVGDGLNDAPTATPTLSYDSNGNIIGGTAQTTMESQAFTNGKAYQNQGFEVWIDFTNTNAVNSASISFTEFSEDGFTVGGAAKAVAYGGWEYTDPSLGYQTGYFTHSDDGGGNTTGPDDFGQSLPLTPNFRTLYESSVFDLGVSSGDAILAPGETLSIGFWASGSTKADAGQAVPEPSMVGLLACGFGALLLRRKSG